MRMNNKGASTAFQTTTTIGIPFVVAIFLVIVFLIFLCGGGASTIFNISKTINNIPTFVWIVLGIVILFKLIGGKK